MAINIPKASTQFGQQVEETGPRAQIAPLVTDANIFAAKAVGDAYDAMGRAVTRGVGTMINTIEEAQKSVEATRSKEFQSEYDVKESQLRRKIEEEEKEFLKANGRLFTPEETKNKYEQGMNSISNDMFSRYKFDYARDEIQSWSTRFVERNYENYQSTVVHQKTVDATTVSLENSFQNYISKAKEAYSSGNAPGVVDALYQAEQVLKNPEQVIVRGGEAKHAMWYTKAIENFKQGALKFMRPEERIKLYDDFKKDPIATMSTPYGSFFKDYIGTPEFEERVVHDISLVRQQQNAARAEQNRVWETNQTQHTVAISDAETQALLTGKPFNYNALRDNLNEARQRGEIGPAQYAQSLEKLNNSIEKISSKNASAEDRAIRRADINERRQSADYQRYGSFYDATQGIKPNIADSKEVNQLERAWVDKVAPAMSRAKTPQEREQLATEVMTATGYVPRQLLNPAIDDLSSGDKDRVARGIAQINQGQQFEPTITSRLPDAARVAYEIGSTTSAERGATVSKNYSTVDPARRKDLLTHELPKQLKDATGTNSQSAAMGKLLRDNFKYELPPSAVNEADRLMGAHFVNTQGDIKAASKMVVEDLRNKYQYTSVDGRPRYLPMTPEKVVGVTPDSKESAALTRIFQDHLKAQNIPDSEYRNYIIGTDEVTMRPSDPTQVWFRVYRLDSNNTPYPVMIKNSQGVEIPFRIMFTKEEMVDRVKNDTQPIRDTLQSMPRPTVEMGTPTPGGAVTGRSYKRNK